MEPRVLHVNEADAVRDLAAILKRVQAGAEVIIERDAQPLAVIRNDHPFRRLTDRVDRPATRLRSSNR